MSVHGSLKDKLKYIAHNLNLTNNTFKSQIRYAVTMLIISFLNNQPVKDDIIPTLNQTAVSLRNISGNFYHVDKPYKKDGIKLCDSREINLLFKNFVIENYNKIKALNPNLHLKFKSHNYLLDTPQQISTHIPIQFKAQDLIKGIPIINLWDICPEIYLQPMGIKLNYKNSIPVFDTRQISIKGLVNIIWNNIIEKYGADEVKHYQFFFDNLIAESNRINRDKILNNYNQILLEAVKYDEQEYKSLYKDFSEIVVHLIMMLSNDSTPYIFSNGNFPIADLITIDSGNKATLWSVKSRTGNKDGAATSAPEFFKFLISLYDRKEYFDILELYKSSTRNVSLSHNNIFAYEGDAHRVQIKKEIPLDIIDCVINRTNYYMQKYNLSEKSDFNKIYNEILFRESVIYLSNSLLCNSEEKLHYPFRYAVVNNGKSVTNIEFSDFVTNQELKAIEKGWLHIDCCGNKIRDLYYTHCNIALLHVSNKEVNV